MTIIMREEWTLSEAARLLDQPQHRLIYLCEKRVVVPDFANAAGRGSSRRFSARNLLEFAVALRLRDLSIPVGPVAAILHVLRSFEKAVARQMPGFNFPQGLRKKDAPELHIVISDGERLFFTLGLAHARPKVFGGVDFRRLTTGKMPRVSEKQLGAVSKPTSEGSGLGPGERARLEVSVTRIAQELPL